MLLPSLAFDFPFFVQLRDEAVVANVLPENKPLEVVRRLEPIL